MQVLKFGGTSVNDAKAIAQVVAIVGDQRRSDRQVVTVTSAMRGVTDLLIGDLFTDRVDKVWQPMESLYPPDKPTIPRWDAWASAASTGAPSAWGAR